MRQWHKVFGSVGHTGKPVSDVTFLDQHILRQLTKKMKQSENILKTSHSIFQRVCAHVIWPEQGAAG